MVAEVSWGVDTMGHITEKTSIYLTIGTTDNRRKDLKSAEVANMLVVVASNKWVS